MVAAAAGWDENAPTVRRTLLALTAIVCLTLCVALAGVQVYVVTKSSFGFNPRVPWARDCVIAFWRGGLGMQWWTEAPGLSYSASQWRALGLFWESRTQAALRNYYQNNSSVTTSQVVLPYWFLYTLLLVAPGGWVWGRYRRRRQGRGFPVILAGEGERQPNG